MLMYRASESIRNDTVCVAVYLERNYVFICHVVQLPLCESVCV